MLTPEFLTAGKAVFTVSNPTGAHYTFRVKVGADKYRPGSKILFVGLLTGPDNTSDYTCIGRLTDAGFVPSQGANATGWYTKPLAVFAWAQKMVQAGREMPAGYAIQHAGHCGRCNRLLTDNQSIARGIGPECIKKMGMAA